MKPRLERIWAPWRSGYLSGTPKRRCIFCTAKRGRADRRAHVVARGKHVFAILNIYPYNNGHVLVAPYRHVGQLAAIRPAEWEELLTLLQQLSRRLQRLLHPHGFNIGINLGRASGAGIPGHLHAHLVPRWHADTNFMPVVAGTKVISQSLDELDAVLRRPV